MKDSLFNRHLHSCRQSSSTPRPRNATNNKSADYPLTSKEGSDVKGWAKAQGYERYLGSSIKGESAIDWSDKRARAGLLATIVADADRLLELSRQAQEALPEGSPERQGIVAAAELPGQLLLQSLPPTRSGDVERTGEGIDLKDGVSKDRVMSVAAVGGSTGTRRRLWWTPTPN